MNLFSYSNRSGNISAVPPVSADGQDCGTGSFMKQCIGKAPEILGEPLCIIARSLPVASGGVIDYLALDRAGALVVIELADRFTLQNSDWHGVRFASQISALSKSEIVDIFAHYLQSDHKVAHEKMEAFLNCETGALNRNQKIILVAREFATDVLGDVHWLRGGGIDITCVRMSFFKGRQKTVLIMPEIILPIKESKGFSDKLDSNEYLRCMSAD